MQRNAAGLSSRAGPGASESGAKLRNLEIGSPKKGRGVRSRGGKQARALACAAAPARGVCVNDRDRDRQRHRHRHRHRQRQDRRQRQRDCSALETSSINLQLW